jgi:hypothetical protein
MNRILDYLRFTDGSIYYDIFDKNITGADTYNFAVYHNHKWKRPNNNDGYDFSDIYNYSNDKIQAGNMSMETIKNNKI